MSDCADLTLTFKIIFSARLQTAKGETVIAEIVVFVLAAGPKEARKGKAKHPGYRHGHG